MVGVCLCDPPRRLRVILCGAILDHLLFIYFHGLVEVYRTGGKHPYDCSSLVF